MIMYSWKQFGNDFKNGDDAVFWDSNRPRDDNWTKIRPWLQGDKWSFRDVNKKTDFSMFWYHWLGKITWSTTWYLIPIPFKQKRTESDVTWYTVDLPNLQASKINNPNYRINKENIRYLTADWVKSIESEVLEIVEDGLYQIQMFWQFVMQWSYDLNNCYQYKFYAALLQPNDNLWYWSAFDLVTTRWVWNQDLLKTNNTQVLQAWQKIAAWYFHTWNNWVANVMGTIIAIRLW